MVAAPFNSTGARWGISQPGVLGLDVVDRELSDRDAILGTCVPVRLHGWVAGRLQQELRAIRLIGRDDREPRVVPQRDVPVLREAQHVGVEGEGCSLVVDIKRY